MRDAKALHRPATVLYALIYADELTAQLLAYHCCGAAAKERVKNDATGICACQHKFGDQLFWLLSLVSISL